MPRYSLKKPTHWLWRSSFTREQVLRQLADGKITGAWLVCPLGESDHAITVDRFASTPDALAPRTSSRELDTDEREEDETSIARAPWLTFWLILACSNFFMLPVVAGASPNVGELLAGGVAGVLCAEVMLLATWAVFSPARFARRLAISACMGLLAFVSLSLPFIPVSIAEPEAFFVLLVALAHCPLLFFAVQMPLWCTRIWLRFEVARSGEPSRGSYLQPTSIKDLIVATAAIGVALAIVRMANAGTAYASQGQVPLNPIFTFFAYLSVGAAVASALTATPLMLITLRTRHSTAFVMGVVVWLVAISCLLSLVIMIAGSPLLHFGLFGTTSCAFVTCIGFYLARRAGYRLRVLKQACST